MRAPCCWAVRRCGALSVAGADGVQMVMEHMRNEMVRAMRLSGANELAALTPRSGEAMSGTHPHALTSTGKLRIGVASSRHRRRRCSFVKEADAQNAPRGVTVDLGKAMAK